MSDNQIIKAFQKEKSLSNLLNMKTSKALFDLSFKMESLKELLIDYRPEYYPRERVSKSPLCDIVCEVHKLVPHLEFFSFLEAARTSRNLLVHSPLKLIESKDSLNLVFILSNNLDNVLLTIYKELQKSKAQRQRELQRQKEQELYTVTPSSISSDFRKRD